MATKLKNLMYSPPIKVIGVLLMIICVSIFSLSILTLNIIGGAYGTSSYYQTGDFYFDYGRVSHNAVEKLLVLKSEKSILASEQDDYSINMKIKRIRTIEENLESASGFVYVLENTDTGELMTNIANENPVEHIQKLKTSLLYEFDNVFFPDGSVLDYYEREYHYSEENRYNGYMTTQILEILNNANKESGQNWRYYTAIMDEVPDTDLFFYNDYQKFAIFSGYRDLSYAALSVSATMLLVGMIWLLFVCGQSRRHGEVTLSAYDEIPHELQTIITSALIAPLGAYLSVWISPIKANEILTGLALIALFVTIFFVGVLVQYTSLIRLVKKKQFIKKLAIARLLRSIFGLFKLPKLDKWYRVKLIAICVGWMFVNLMLVVFMFIGEGMSVIGVTGFLLLNGLVIYRLLYFANDLKGMMDKIHMKRLGHRYDEVAVPGLSRVLVNFAEDLDALQEGLDVAVEERIKGEKFKTELITNVTHDLKNPLTSIISYVELLKTKDTADEETKKYVDVLDEKANRLKTLIEQLVDASKASSGNVEVKLESVDIIQLSRQMCGEFSDKLEASNLECVIHHYDEPFYVEADPMILYRIVENLMSNVTKYSMAGTRVYVDVTEDNNKVVYSIKNISKEPLNMDISDLSRRFVRGDSSRNTEGSGLGLSIALSLSKLMGANLVLDIDGDLFKAVLTLNKGTKKQLP